MGVWSERYAAWRLGDWLFIVFLIGFYVLLYFIQPHHRVITDDSDPALRYPLQTETVSAALLFFFAVGLPLVTFAAFAYLRRALPHTRAEFQNVLLAFLLAILLDLLTTDSIKKLTGRPRPNFIALAGYVGGQVTGSTADVREAYQSFVSGHASLSFAGLLFLSQFLFQHLSPLSPLHIAHSLTVDKVGVHQLSRINNLPSLFIPAIPVALALWISLTRIIDYWHFCEDVVGGILVGSFYAYTMFNYAYLERRWTWLSVHPLPGVEMLVSEASPTAAHGSAHTAIHIGDAADGDPQRSLLQQRQA